MGTVGLVDAPFSTAEARENGLGRGALRGPSVSRRLRGVYLPADVPVTLAVEVAAARKVLPSDVLVDGTTALHVYGVEVGEARPLRFVSAHAHQVAGPVWWCGGSESCRLTRRPGWSARRPPSATPRSS